MHLTAADGTSRDTVIAFPAGVDSLVIEMGVPAGGDGQSYNAVLELRDATHTVLFSGTQTVTAHTSSQPGVSSPVVPVTYAGPGKGTKTVTVAPVDPTASATATTNFSASAVDSSGKAITDLLVRWTSSDVTLATATSTSNTTASVAGLGRRGVVTISAITPSGVAGTSRLTLVPPPARVVVIGGGSQTGTAGSILAQPFVVEVQATDNLPVAGQPVTFRAVTAGGAVTTATATTDATGRASTTFTLGQQTGPYIYEAASGTLTPVTVTATATPAPAATIAVVSGNGQTDSIGRALALPLVAKVADQFGNAVANATVTWTRSGTNGGTLGAPSSVTSADGTTSDTYVLGSAVGADTVRASVTGVSAPAVFTMQARARNASAIVIVSGGSQTGTPSLTLPNPLVAKVTDVAGNPVSGATVTWGASANGATFGTASATTGANGQVSTIVTLGSTAGVVAVTASVGTLTVATSLTIVTGPPATITRVTGDAQSAAVATAVPVAPSVLVKDAGGNPVVGAPVTFAAASGGGSVTGASATTNASGIAAVGSWTLGATAGANTLTATAGALSTTFTATGTSTVATKFLVVQAPPASITVGVAIPAIKVRLADATNNPVAQAGVVVTLTGTVTTPDTDTPVPGPHDAAPPTDPNTFTTTANTDATGLATFTLPSFNGTVGNVVFTISAPGITPLVTTPAPVLVGAPAQFVIKTQPPATASIGIALSPAPVVRLADAGGNPVGPGANNITLVASIASGGGALGGTTSVQPNASGVFTFANLVLNGVPGARTLQFASANFPLNTLTSSTITVGPGIPTTIDKTAGNAQTATVGTAVAVAPTVRLTNASESPVAGIVVTFAVASGGGSVTGATATTDASGNATVGSWTLGSVAGANTLTATAGGLTTTFSATGVAATGAKLTLVQAPPATLTVGVTAPTMTVQVRDALDNPVASAGVPVTMTVAQVPGGVLPFTLTQNTDATGLATFVFPAYSGPVGQVQLTFSASGLTPVVSSPINTLVGAPAQLAVTTQPSPTAIPNAVLAQQPVVQVKDVAGNPVPTAGIAVHAAIASGVPGLSGTVDVVTDATGAAHFTNLAVTGASGTRALAFTSGTLTGATSNAINAASGAATSLVLQVQPPATVANNTAMSPAPVVQVTDALGNPVAGAGQSVTATIASGGGTITAGGVAITDAAGVATFTTLTITGTVGTRTLQFQAGALTPVVSNAVNVTAGAPSQFVVKTQAPATASIGVALSPAPSVQLADAGGNPVGAGANTITLVASIATGGGTLAGTTSVQPDASGVFTFANLVLNGVPGARTLQFASSNFPLNTLTSSTITVGPGIPATIDKTGGNAQTATVGTTVAIAPTVRLTNASESPVAGIVVTFAVASGGGSVTGATATTDASGNATVGSWKLGNVAGANTLTATAGGLTTTFTATGVAATGVKLSIVQAPPTTFTVGVTAPTMSVQVRDALDNPVASAGVPVTITTAQLPATPLPYTFTQNTDANGLATFVLPVYNGPAGQIQLTFSAGGLTPVLSAPITTLVGAATQLAVTTQPSPAAIPNAVLAQQPVVQLKDAGGNNVPTAGITVHAAIATGVPGISGTVDVATDATGAAHFTNLAVTGASGSRVLGFTSGALTGATSNPINAAPGAASSIAIVTGSGQTSQINTAVSVPPQVKLLDAFGNTVAGTLITFTPRNGSKANGSTAPVQLSSSGNGTAQVSWILGATAAPNADTLEVSIAGASSVLFVATGTAASAAKLVLLVQPPATVANNTAMSPAPVVQVVDAFGNPVAGAGVSITATIASGGGAITAGGVATTDANGSATFAGLVITGATGSRTLQFQGAALTPVVSNSVNVTIGAPTQFILKMQPPATGSIGVALAPAPSVQLADAGGNPVGAGANNITLVASIASGGGTLAGTTSVQPDASGAFTFTNLVLNGVPGARTLQFASTNFPLNTLTSSTITVGPGIPTTIDKTAGNAQTATVGTTVPVAPSVRLTNASENPVAGIVVTFAVASGGGSITGATATTNASGIATVGSWTLGNGAGANTLTATAGSLTTTFTATGTAAMGARLAIIQAPPATVTVGVTGATITVQVRDALDNPVASVGVPITMSVVQLPGTTIPFTLTQNTDASGLATFVIPVYNGPAGQIQLTFSSGGLTPAVSSPITTLVGAAAQLAVTTQPPPTATPNAVLAPQPVVQVRDAGGNNVSTAGIMVHAAIASGVGGISGTADVATDATGAAHFTNLAVTGPNGTRTMGFTSGALTGTTSIPVSAVNGAAASIAIVSGNGQTRQVNTNVSVAPLVVVTDAFGNTVAGATVTFAPRNGSKANGITAPIQIATGPTGATFVNWTLGGVAATNADTLEASIAGAPSVLFVATGTAAPAASLVLLVQPPATVANNTAMSPAPVVQVTDAFGNPVPGAGQSVTATIAAGGGTIAAGGVAITNAAGVATFSALTINGTIGTRTLQFQGGGLTPAVSNAVNVTVGSAYKVGLSGGPANLTVETQSGSPFATPFVVQILDISGNPVNAPNIPLSISFYAQPSATPPALSQTSATTDATGKYTWTSLAVSGLAGTYGLNFFGTNLLTGISQTFTITSGAASVMVAQTPQTQTAQAGSSVAVPPAVKVTDAGGNPVQGVTVSFHANTAGSVLVSNSGSGTTVNAVSNVAGVALLQQWSIGGSLGAHTVTATANGLTGSPLTFSTNAIVGPASKFSVLSGLPTSVTVGAPIAPIVVQLTDAFGNPVQMAGVTITATAAMSPSGVALGSVSVSTNSAGQSSITLPPYSGPTGQITVSLSAPPTYGITPFTSSTIPILAGSAAKLLIATQPPVTLPSGAPMGPQPTVQVTDAGGNVVNGAGVNVTASLASGDPALTGTTTVATNASGLATFTNLSISGVPGSRTLQFTSPGLATAIASQPTVVGTGAAANITSNSPTTITAQVATNVPSGAQVKVTDATGNPVSGVFVTFTASGTGSTINNGVTNGSTATVATNAQGVAAVAAWTLGQVAQAYTVTATAAVAGSPVTFTTTATPGPVTSIAITPHDVTLTPGATQAYTAVGRDLYNNVTPITPAWSVINGGGTIDPSTGVFTAGNVANTFGSTIFVTSNAISSSASVTVTAGVLTSIVVTPNPATVTAAGQKQFTAVGRDAQNNVVAITPVWSVVNGGGTIDANGLFTAAATAGTYANTVRVTSGGVTTNVSVQVVPGYVASVVVSPSPASMVTGATKQFTAAGFDLSGNPVPITPVWSVTNGGGTIDSNGLFTAGAVVGSFANTVFATSDAISGYASVNITAAVPASVTTASGAQLTRAPSGTVAPGVITFVVKDGSGNPLPAGTLLAFTRSSTTTCTIPSSALTTAGGIATLDVTLGGTTGACIITARTTNNRAATAKIVVVPAGATHAWFGGFGESSGIFEVPNNWLNIATQQNEVPSGKEHVPYIASGLPQPTASTDKVFGGLMMDVSATLNLNAHTLTVNGSILSLNTSDSYPTFSNGAVVVRGHGSEVTGHFTTLTLGAAGYCTGPTGDFINVKVVIASNTTVNCGTTINSFSGGSMTTTSGSFISVNKGGNVYAADSHFNGDSVVVGDSAQFDAPNPDFAGRLVLGSGSELNTYGDATFRGGGNITDGYISLGTGTTTFGGVGSTGYTFTGGEMGIGGHFAQVEGGSGPAFVATANYAMCFCSTGTHTISFAQGEKSSSTLGSVYIGRGDDVTFLTGSNQSGSGEGMRTIALQGTLRIPEGVNVEVHGPLSFVPYTGSDLGGEIYGSLVVDGALKIDSCTRPGGTISGIGTINGKAANTIICSGGIEWPGGSAGLRAAPKRPAPPRQPAPARKPE